MNLSHRWPRPPASRHPVRPLVVLLLLLGAPVSSGAQSADEGKAMQVLRVAAERYEALDALCADFYQVRKVPLLDQVTESRGRLCHKDPNLFLMDFSEPEGDVIVADGEHLWIYYPSMDPKQVFRQPLDGGGGRFDFHREFLSAPGAKYAPEHLGSGSVDGHATHVLRLVPRKRSAYSEARVWIDAERYLIRKVLITEENDSEREVTLSRLQVEPELSSGLFRFIPPEGATVVRR